MLACATCLASQEGHPSCLFVSLSGVLVVPHWPSAHYLPLLVKRGSVFKSFVADCLYVENGKDVFLHGGTRVPFLDQRIFVPQCFFCSSTVLRGNRCSLPWSCRPFGRLTIGPLGQFTTNALFFFLFFLPVHEYCPFLRYWLFCM